MPDDLKVMASDPNKKFLLDPYLDWTKGEGLPVYEDFGLDAFDCSTRPWARFDAEGAFLHVAGRGDFVSCFALELDPGRKTAPMKQLFEAISSVIDGHGSTTVWTREGRKHSFEWAPKSMFAIPLNCRYQHFNTAPEPARYMAIAVGSRRYPFTEMRRKGVESAVDTSIAKGGRQVEYEDQDPRIHPIWLAEIAKTGVTSQMGDIFDETGCLRLS